MTDRLDLRPATHFVTRDFLENAEAEGLRLALLELASEHGLRVAPLEVNPTVLPTIDLKP